MNDQMAIALLCLIGVLAGWVAFLHADLHELRKDLRAWQEYTKGLAASLEEDDDPDPGDPVDETEDRGVVVLFPGRVA